MPVQPATAYDITHKEAVNGAIADMQNSNTRSILMGEDADFGRLVCRDGAGLGVLPTAAGQITDPNQIWGILSRVQDNVANANDVLQATANRDATVCNGGVIWVLVEDAVTADQPCFVVNTGANRGMFRSDATLATQAPNMKFDSSAGAGEFARVEIQLVPA